MIQEFFQPLVEWYMGHINYASVFLLMTVESSFIPFPSEIVVPPAAWKAAQGELNLGLVILFAGLGALAGAFINYFLARSLGRAVVHRLADTKLAHMIMIDRQGIEKAEAYFIKHGNVSTLIGRLLPAIRQLISLPAGLARMRLLPFTIYTTLGSTAWNVVLALLGYYLFSQKELLEQYYHQITYAMLGLGAVFFAWLVYKGVRKPKSTTNT